MKRPKHVVKIFDRENRPDRKNYWMETKDNMSA